MNGDEMALRPVSVLYIALAAIASVAIGRAAVDAGLWLVVAALLVGWAPWIAFVARVQLELVPRRLAEAALDDRWKHPDRGTSEAFVHHELVTIARGNTPVLARRDDACSTMRWTSADEPWRRPARGGAFWPGWSPRVRPARW